MNIKNLKGLFSKLKDGGNIARNLIEDNAGRAAMSSDLLSDRFLDALEGTATHVPVTGPNDIYSLFSEPTVADYPTVKSLNPKNKKTMPNLGYTFDWSEDLF